MAPIPSPYFPEPITVPGNVAAGDYPTAVRFLRTTGLGHLLSLAAIVMLTISLRRLGFAAEGLGSGAVWLMCLGSLIALAWLRHGPILIQALTFVTFALALAAGVAAEAPLVFDELYDFAFAFRLAFLSAWLGLVFYNLLAARDYSLVGQYVLVCCFAGASMVYFTLTTYLTGGQGFAVWVLVCGMVFYWVYDLAMISRRRRADEPLAAVFDLYRDVFNFVGFPLRMLRMPRGRRRFQAKW
jgi:hypothetical protein